ncbi:MAG TPA: CDP-diacylglycerol--serine O-phosphatidyltransferase [Planctomycetaceae bacterium]|nr:CDP-diacylglycerol--serine O-phosphatidyltransferase [Planctomycetaceae bacterium]
MLPISPKEKLFPALPTLLTLGNAVCGFGSITMAAKVGPVATEYDTLVVPAFLIFLAMVFDALDGHVARWTRRTSEFGSQLDSLCDLVSFGVAPAFLLLKFPQAYHPRLLWMVAVLFVVCAALRLARFNVQLDEEDTHESFMGLPSPAAAGALASFAIAMPRVSELTDPSMSPLARAVGTWVLPAAAKIIPLCALVLACLMVSRIRYPHVTNQILRRRHRYQQLILLIFAVVASLAAPELIIPLVLGWFVVASPLRAARAKLAVRSPLNWPRHSP